MRHYRDVTGVVFANLADERVRTLNLRRPVDLAAVAARVVCCVDPSINWGYNKLRIRFDWTKRNLILTHRGLDFARAAEVFSGLTATVVDERFDYGETRFITAGHLDGRLVVMVWTQRGEARHIISMRHCHAKEEAIWLRRMG